MCSAVKFRLISSTKSSINSMSRSQREEERSDQRVLVLTVEFLALKNTGFSPVKNTFLHGVFRFGKIHKSLF